MLPNGVAKNSSGDTDHISACQINVCMGAGSLTGRVKQFGMAAIGAWTGFGASSGDVPGKRSSSGSDDERRMVRQRVARNEAYVHLVGTDEAAEDATSIHQVDHQMVAGSGRGCVVAAPKTTPLVAPQWPPQQVRRRGPLLCYP